MDIADPCVPLSLVPPGSVAKVINGPQGDEYLDLPSIRTPDGQIITRWTLNEEERLAILKGEDIFVTLLSAGSINPFFLSVGMVDWTRTQTHAPARPASRDGK